MSDRNTGGTRRRRALKARARVAFQEGFMESSRTLNGESYDQAEENLHRASSQQWKREADTILEEAFEDWWKESAKQ